MSKFSVLARLRKTKSSKVHPVQVVYRHGGEVARFATGVVVAEKHWDAKGRKIKAVAAHPHHAADNAAIAAQIAEVTDVARKLDAAGAELSPEAIKSQLAKLNAPDAPETPEHDAPEQVAKFWRAMLRDKRYTQSSVATHLQSLAHVLAFDPLVTWESITADWLRGFDRYADGLDHKANQRAKTLKNLKAAMRRAWDEGKHANDNFRKSFMRVKFEVATDEIALDADELKAIASAKMPTESLSNARDLFLIQTWTGCRYSDLANLSAANVTTDKDGTRFIAYTSLKTGVDAVIPVHPSIAHLATPDPATWPRIIANPKLNKYVKLVARAAGLDRAEQVVTSSGRRTFVTYMLDAGVPPELVRGMTGHKTEKAFAGYSRYGAKDKARKTAKLAAFAK